MSASLARVMEAVGLSLLGEGPADSEGSAIVMHSVRTARFPRDEGSPT